METRVFLRCCKKIIYIITLVTTNYSFLSAIKVRVILYIVCPVAAKIPNLPKDEGKTKQQTYMQYDFIPLKPICLIRFMITEIESNDILLRIKFTTVVKGFPLKVFDVGSVFNLCLCARFARGLDFQLTRVWSL